MIFTARADSGEIVSVSDQILVTENFYAIKAGTHLCLKQQNKYNMTHTFKVIATNGIPDCGYMLANSFFKDEICRM